MAVSSRSGLLHSNAFAEPPRATVRRRVAFHDRDTGRTELVNWSAPGTSRRRRGWLGALSGDGSTVLFRSSGIVAGPRAPETGPWFAFDRGTAPSPRLRLSIRLWAFRSRARVSVSQDGASDVRDLGPECGGRCPVQWLDPGVSLVPRFGLPPTGLADSLRRCRRRPLVRKQHLCRRFHDRVRVPGPRSSRDPPYVRLGEARLPPGPRHRRNAPGDARRAGGSERCRGRNRPLPLAERRRTLFAVSQSFALGGRHPARAGQPLPVRPGPSETALVSHVWAAR
jgi:hypothetical protein